jgi:hypothetical protein
MEAERRHDTRITLSIALETNELLEAIQSRLRKAGHRRFKSEIIHEALECFAQGQGLEQVNDGEPGSDARAAAGEAAGLE